MSTARKFPSPSAIKHVVVPEAELTTHSLGGGPDGGEVYSLAIAPTQPATVFAAFGPAASSRATIAARTGRRPIAVCRKGARAISSPTPSTRRSSTRSASPICSRRRTGGATWQQLDVDDADAPIIAPSDSRILYERPGPASIVRSVDGGRHWTQNATSGLPDGAGPCAVDPRNAFLLVRRLVRWPLHESRRRRDVDAIRSRSAGSRHRDNRDRSFQRRHRGTSARSAAPCIRPRPAEPCGSAPGTASMTDAFPR